MTQQQYFPQVNPGIGSLATRFASLDDSTRPSPDRRQSAPVINQRDDRPSYQAYERSHRSLACGIGAVVLLAGCAACIVILTMILVSIAKVATSTTANGTMMTRWKTGEIRRPKIKEYQVRTSAIELSASNGFGAQVTRMQCPKTVSSGDGKMRAVAISVVELRPKSGTRAPPRALDLSEARMVCSFDGKTSGPRIVAVIPRTSCVNAECACSAATREEWALISIHGEGSVQLAAAFSVAEDQNTGAALPMFELATVMMESSMENNKLLPDTEKTAVPASCKLTWSDDDIAMT